MRYLLMSAFVAVMAFASVVANGKPNAFDDCTVALNDLITATQNARSLSAKDQQGLIGKATSARDDYQAGKTEDALQKLNDYQVKLNQLHNAPKPKISENDYQALQAALDNAVGCISGSN